MRRLGLVAAGGPTETFILARLDLDSVGSCARRRYGAGRTPRSEKERDGTQRRKGAERDVLRVPDTSR
jgi:hypothetical protein